MGDLKTFEDSDNTVSFDSVDQLCAKQKEDVAKMRASLLACSDSPISAKQASNNITILRVYHQISRIIRYTEMCDKIEDKIYQSLDSTLASSDADDPKTWSMLLTAQERLQNLLINSHKLLEPYLNLKNFTDIEVTSTEDSRSSDAMNLDAAAREKIRTNAQKVLSELSISGGASDG